MRNVKLLRRNYGTAVYQVQGIGQVIVHRFLSGDHPQGKPYFCGSGFYATEHEALLDFVAGYYAPQEPGYLGGVSTETEGAYLRVE